MKTDAVRKMLSSFPDVEARPHFDRTAWRTPARIFATLGASGDLNIKLTPDQQQMLTSTSAAFAKIANKWGDQGWTTCDVASVTAAQLKPVLAEAWALAAPPLTGGRSRRARK